MKHADQCALAADHTGPCMWVGGRRPEDPVYPNRATEPTTAAGKRLLTEDNLRTRPALAVWCAEHGFASPEHLVAAIEAEAVAAALARVRDRVVGVLNNPFDDADWCGAEGMRRQVLAILDEEPASHPASHQSTPPEREAEHE